MWNLPLSVSCTFDRKVIEVISSFFCWTGIETAGRELTVTFLKDEAEVSVWEAWLPQAHAAQKQSQRTGKKGVLAIECPPVRRVQYTARLLLFQKNAFLHAFRI
jgi:hypothetical protein